MDRGPARVCQDMELLRSAVSFEGDGFHIWRGSAECEIKHRDAWIEKFDLELPVLDGPRLPYQLIHSRRFGYRAITLAIGISSVSGGRRLSIDQHAKAHRCTARRQTHDEIKVAGMKAVRDPPVGLVEYGSLFPYGPITRKGPMIESQPRRGRIDVTLV